MASGETTSASATGGEAATGAVVTRFAPSPTGFLHIGGARTALFNHLFARASGGRFLLRVEDTDRERSTDAATEAIFAGLRWLGVDWDGEAVSQYARAPRHREAAEAMLASGAAYRCYASREEIDAARAEADATGRPPIFESPWRDHDGPPPSPDAPYAVRLKAPREGETVVEDAVQGRVVWKNETLDDLILLRSNGDPTYMLAVVVDDHDMGVTHVIRGDDHLTNAARQSLIYQGLGWRAPIFAHIPLIHGQDGAKLSKRHGALGVEAYRDMGFIAEGLRNYLTRLGWSHGDEEFFTDAQAREWFGFGGMGKAPARLDLAKLAHLNGLHLRALDLDDVHARLVAWMAAERGADDDRRAPRAVPDAASTRLRAALPALVERAKTLAELEDGAYFCLADAPLAFDAKAAAAIGSEDAQAMLRRLRGALDPVDPWTAETLKSALDGVAAAADVKFGKVAQPLRAALTARAASPGVLDVMGAIGRDETLARIDGALDKPG